MIINPFLFSQYGNQDRDPYFSNVSLLLHMNGANDSTTFIDSSSYAHTVTASGTAKQSTSNAKFGSASSYTFDNAGYLELPDHASLNLTSGDWTIEGWIYGPYSDQFTYTGYLWTTVAVGGQYSIIFRKYASVLSLLISDSAYNYFINQQDNDSITADTWTHVAACRAGNVYYSWMNGAAAGQTTNATAIATGASYVHRIGWGSIQRKDEWRVTKGVARYTSAFTPPSAPFSDS